MLGEKFLREDKYKHAHHMKSVTENATTGLRPDSTDTDMLIFSVVSGLNDVTIQNKTEQVLNLCSCSGPYQRSMFVR